MSTSYYNKDAVERLYKNIGEVTLTDRKGTWIVHFPTRRWDPKGWSYFQRINFKPDLKRLPKANPEGRSQMIEFIDLDKDYIKKEIKRQIGYQPEQPVVAAIHELLESVCGAYMEEDAYYYEQDTERAKAELQQLLESAEKRIECMGREQRNTLLQLSIYRLRNEVLKSDELARISELIKIIEDSSTLQDGWEQTFLFDPLNAVRNRQLDKVQVENEERKYQQILSLLDTDIEFRRLAAATQVDPKDLRFGNLKIEVVHRMYGYTTSREEYFKVLEHMNVLFQKHELRFTTDFEVFLKAVSEYVKDNLLPGNSGLHKREVDMYAYGDVIYYIGKIKEYQFQNYTVSQVTKRGIQVDYAYKFMSNEISHYVYKQPVEESPRTVKEWVDYELSKLNNSKHGQGAELELDSFIQAIHYWNGSGKLIDWAIQRYDKWIDNEQRSTRRAALQLLRDTTRMHQLKKLLKTFEGNTSIETLDTHQKELEELNEARATLYTVSE